MDKQLELMSSANYFAPNSQQNPSEWVAAFNTSLLTTISPKASAGQELSKLMQEPEFMALVHAAQWLASERGCSKEAATEKLITAFRKLDRCWQDVVRERGLQAMLSGQPKP